MREILFRGKRLKDGKWVEGYIVPYALSTYEEGIEIISTDGINYDELDGWQPSFSGDYVNPETVGQFTGMTDKNGKEIFEGDVVAFTRVNALGWNTHRVGEVRYYDELPIFYIMASTGDAWDWVDCENIEVIGNIFDDPELMEGGESNG